LRIEPTATRVTNPNCALATHSTARDARATPRTLDEVRARSIARRSFARARRPRSDARSSATRERTIDADANERARRERTRATR
jgi:hypothetical protein